MKRCVRCILPESFPGLTFNSEGVCSVCEKFDKRTNAIVSLEKLKLKFEQIIDESKTRNLRYDALVAFSGGKDSTYLIYELKKTYGLKILAFTFDNGFISENTFNNIRKVLEILDVDHIIFKPRYDLTKKIFLTSADSNIYPSQLLKFGSSICISCIRIVNNISLKTAIDKKIPMVMLGNSPGQLIQSESEIIYKDNKIPYEMKKKLFKPLADKLGDDVYDFLLLNEEEYHTSPFPYTISPFPIIGYDEKIIYQAITKLGWRRPKDVDPNSSNCRLNSFGIVKHREKLNYHPYDYEMSMLVRLGKISRDEALRRVEDPEGLTIKLAKKVENDLR
ncbi:MAG: 7-cyano-7-deazaguanine synthase [Candidatus Zixiibacteriota bacterium]|nr:MAG: 7-cyano-7-deazaguanine synthase [candidate division Zixibacteria bacterium]